MCNHGLDIVQGVASRGMKKDSTLFYFGEDENHGIVPKDEEEGRITLTLEVKQSVMEDG